MTSPTFPRFLVQNAPFLGTGAFLTFLSCFGQTFLISVFAGEIRHEFGLSHGQWGGIFTLGTALSAIAMVWAGALADRFRVRVLGPIVLAGLAAACLLMAANTAVAGLVLVIFLLRFFGQGMLSHLAVVSMARWFVATRGRALSIASLGFRAGEALMPLLLVSLLGFFEWRHLWLASALICLAGIPILMRLLSKERTPGDLAKGDSSLGMGGAHWTRAETLRSPLFWMMIPALLGPPAFGTALFFHQVHIAEIKGLGHAGLVALFPVYTIVSIAVMVVSGWALDRMGTARLVPYHQLPMIAAFVIFATANGPLTMLAGFVCFAMSTGASATLQPAFWAEFYGTAHIGSIKALATAVMVFGSAIGPGLTGIVIDFGIGLETQFMAVGAYFLLTTGLMTMGVGRARRLLGAGPAL